MHIVLFFTYGVSLSRWKSQGLLDREKSYFKQFIDAGHQITWVTYGDEEDRGLESSLEGIRIFPLYRKVPKNKFLKLVLSNERYRELGALCRSADIIRTNQMDGVWLPIKYAAKHKKKLLLRCGFDLYRNMERDKTGSPLNWLMRKVYRRIEGHAYHHADKIILSSESDKQFVIKEYSINDDKVAVIRNPIDTSLYRKHSDQNNSDTVKKRLFTASRLHPSKQIDLIIKSMADNGSWRLVVAGTGPEKKNLIELAKKLKIEIELLGNISQSEMVRELNRCDFYVSASAYEGSPKSVIEAMSASCLVLASDIEAHKELIVDGVNGFLCSQDGQNMKEVLKEMSRLNKDDVIRIRSAAREWVNKNSSLEIAYKSEISIHDTLLNNPSKPHANSL